LKKRKIPKTKIIPKVNGISLESLTKNLCFIIPFLSIKKDFFMHNLFRKIIMTTKVNNFKIKISTFKIIYF
tara:strand:+ start:109 stop:321 length:213 start_codon:yes stop_codon:yes gene_type:complete